MVTEYQYKVKKLRDALKAVSGIKISHYRELEQDRYIVWAETGQTSGYWADNEKYVQGLKGEVALFTNVEYDTVVDEIQEAFLEASIDWELRNVKHDPAMDRIGYLWDVTVD